MGQEREHASLYWELFITFVKIGAFTLGGGYAMLAMVEKAVVEQRKWITEKDFWDMITLVQTLPGVFAINTALYVGYRIKGIKASLAAMVGAALPSFVIILLIALFFQQFENNAIVEAIFKGIRPAVVALIAAPCIRLARTAGITLSNVWIPLGAVMLIWIFKVSPVYIILTICVCGFIYARFIKPQE